MFNAINKITGGRVNSLTLEQDSSYQFIDEEIWYADPNEIEDCPKELNITKIKVLFRKGHRTINFNGTEYVVSPHFYIPNKTKLGINTIPESKEHKLAKNWIYNKIKQNKLILNYSSINKPYKYKNQINLFDLPINIQKIGIEISSSVYQGGKRRADVICPFITKHPILGNGVVFEIQFTKQKIKTKINRELDWAIRGYSICWLYKEDFEQITDLIIDLKKESVDVDSFANLIKQNNKRYIKELKYTIQEECRKLDEKKYNIIREIREEKFKNLQLTKEEIKEIINEQIEELKSNIQPTCPNCNIPFVLKNRRDGSGKFWACINYPGCTCVSNYGGEEW